MEENNNHSNDLNNNINSDGAQNESAQDTASKQASDELLQQVQKIHNDYLYLKADFDNYKKRMIKEKSDISKYGSESLIISLLDLVDNFDRALSLEIKPENLSSFVDGVKMLSTEFKTVLGRYGVTEVPSLGAAFDPNFHEALGAEPSTEYPSGHISKVFSKPYKLHDRIVRPGRVVIASDEKK